MREDNNGRVDNDRQGEDKGKNNDRQMEDNDRQFSDHKCSIIGHKFSLKIYESFMDICDQRRVVIN